MNENTAVVGNSHGDDAEGDEQLSKVILFEDVTDYLFSVTSEEARLSLVSQFIEFYGGRISQWFVKHLILISSVHFKTKVWKLFMNEICFDFITFALRILKLIHLKSSCK